MGAGAALPVCPGSGRGPNRRNLQVRHGTQEHRADCMPRLESDLSGIRKSYYAIAELLGKCDAEPGP